MSRWAAGNRRSLGGGPMGRLSAGDRLRRMLELVPWIMSQGAAELSEVAQRFDYPEKELREDLVKVLFVVGLYPFTPR